MLPRGPAECAEPAAHETHVGKVYVAVNYVSDDVANSLAPYPIRRQHQSFQFPPARLCQQKTLIEIYLEVIQGALKHASDIPVNLTQQCFKLVSPLPANVTGQIHGIAPRQRQS
jgi:hypothetical protein